MKALGVAAFAAVLSFPSNPPTAETALLLPCKVVSVHDGDTVTVEVTLRANIRIKDVNSPELRDAGGIEAREFTKKELLGKKGLLHVPLEGDDIGDVFSFGRVVGDVSVDSKWISDSLVKAGHAKRVR